MRKQTSVDPNGMSRHATGRVGNRVETTEAVVPSSRRLPQLSSSQTKIWQLLEHAGGSGECWTELMGKSHHLMNLPQCHRRRPNRLEGAVCREVSPPL